MSRSTTPCLGICTTTVGDLVCKGCKRFAHEIVDWNKFDSKEKELVNSRLEGFKQLILKDLPIEWKLAQGTKIETIKNIETLETGLSLLNFLGPFLKKRY